MRRRSLSPWFAALFAAAGIFRTPSLAQVAALGRVLPVSGIVDVAAPAGEVVESVLVKDGQAVDAGALLARLSSAELAQLRVQQAAIELESRRKLADGALELARRRVTVAEFELRTVEARIGALNKEIAPARLELKQEDLLQLARATADVRLYEAQLELARAEVGVRQGVRAAEIALEEARAGLARSEVRAPIKGRVLKVLTTAGSPTGRGELFKLGDTSAMTVLAEVFEGDVARVKPGQRAIVSAAALPKKLGGAVIAVGVMVGRSSVQNIDPAAQTNSRVVEVLIRMDEAAPLDRYVLMQVDVVIGG